MFAPWPQESAAYSLADLFDHRIPCVNGAVPDPKILPAGAGVYLIVDAEDRPVFLSYGQSLRRLITHRLSPPAEDERTKRTNLAEIAAGVCWRETFGPFETVLSHWHIARTLDPKAYRDNLGFSPCWFLRGSVHEPRPRLSSVKTILPDTAAHVGPFATRKDAEAWRQMLEDGFDLCRYPHILDQAPDGEPCAYHEMGKCDAPCDGSVEMSVYRERVAGAMAFSSGRIAPRLDALRSIMQEAAAALAYEKAGEIRKTIDRMKASCKKPDYEFLGDLAVNQWLIIQRASPRRRSAANTWVKPFLIRQGHVQTAEPAKLADIQTAAADWLTACDTPAPPSAADRDEAIRRSEVLWLVAKHLFQRERAQGLFLRLDRLPPAEMLAEQIVETFGTPSD